MMKKNFRKFIAFTMLFTLTFSYAVLAVTLSNASIVSQETVDGGTIYTVSCNGKTFYGYSDSNLGGSGTAYTVKGHPMFFDDDSIVEENDSVTSAALSDEDTKTLHGITNKAKSDLQDISGGMSSLAPSFTQGSSLVGKNIKDSYQSILSVILWIGWAFFLGTELFNGIVVAVPGLYDNIMGNEAANNSGYGGYGGGQNKKGLLAKFLSKNTIKVMSKQGGGGIGSYGGVGGNSNEGEEPIKEWFNGEIVRIICFVIIAVCLFNGLFFKIMDFVLGVFNFGEA